MIRIDLGGRFIRTISGKTGLTIWTHYTNEYGSGGWVYDVDCSYDYNGDGVIDVLATAGDDSFNPSLRRNHDDAQPLSAETNAALRRLDKLQERQHIRVGLGVFAYLLRRQR